MLEPMPSDDPARFGDYELQGLIGDGSTANVYRALAPTGERVALKILARPRPGGSGDPASAFLREAEQLARIDHPCVIRLVGHGLWEGQAFVAMDYFEGTTLERLFETNPPSPERLTTLLIRVCEGLAAAHRQGLLHRDVKPSNILVDDADEVKLVDFGLAKEFGDGVSMTGDGMLLGTPLYMSPEQIRGRPLDGRCDIYAIGAVLYTGLAGRPPFVQRQTAALLMAHLNDAVQPLHEVTGRTWPATVQHVLDRCLSKSRTDRFDTVEQLIEALRAAREALVDPSHDATILQTIQRPRRARGDRALAAPSLLTAGLATLVALGFVYVLAQGYHALTAPETTRLPPAVATRADVLDRGESAPTELETESDNDLLISVEAPPVEPPRRPLRRPALPAEPVEAIRPGARLPRRRTDLKNPFPSLETP